MGASLERLAEARGRGVLPHVTEGGRWRFAPVGAPGRLDPDGWRHPSWTGGFRAGLLWLLSRFRPAAPLEREARAVAELLAQRARDRTTHDLGFLFWPSAVLGYLATGERHLRELALVAARTLAARRLPSGALQTWGTLDNRLARGWTIVDTLANLPLLWWAEREGLDAAGAAARAHASLAARAFVRSDGSTYQALRLADDGTVVERATRQGLAPESTWSRGQAWAVYGFAETFRASGDGWAREAAERTARFFVSRVPPGLVPPWDFDAMAPDEPTDASAAAIAAAGLLGLADAEAETGGQWRDAAVSLLSALVRRCLAPPGEDGLLVGCTSHYHRGEGVGGATAWGDFFLVDALLHLATGRRHLDPVRPAS